VSLISSTAAGGRSSSTPRSSAEENPPACSRSRTIRAGQVVADAGQPGQRDRRAVVDVNQAVVVRAGDVRPPDAHLAGQRGLAGQQVPAPPRGARCGSRRPRRPGPTLPWNPAKPRRLLITRGMHAAADPGAQRQGPRRSPVRRCPGDPASPAPATRRPRQRYTPAQASHWRRRARIPMYKNAAQVGEADRQAEQQPGLATEPRACPSPALRRRHRRRPARRDIRIFASFGKGTSRMQRRPGEVAQQLVEAGPPAGYGPHATCTGTTVLTHRGSWRGSMR